jgi:hypothetical protein
MRSAARTGKSFSLSSSRLSRGYGKAREFDGAGNSVCIQKLAGRNAIHYKKFQPVDMILQKRRIG